MPQVNIFDIKRFAVHDGPGIRTTVFMKGCPLRCWWCHNPESQSPDPVTVDIERKLNGKTVKTKKTYGERIDIEEVMQIVLRDQHFYEESGGGVTFSGGEPMLQHEALLELLTLSRKHGLHTTIDTSGFANQALFKKMQPLTDLFLYDLKNMDSDLHKAHTGIDNKLILANADFLLGEGAQIIFRIPVIPGINTTPGELEALSTFIEERKEKLTEIHLLPYHRIAENKYFRLKMKERLHDVMAPDESMLQDIKTHFETTGLEVVIGG